VVAWLLAVWPCEVVVVVVVVVVLVVVEVVSLPFVVVSVASWDCSPCLHFSFSQPRRPSVVVVVAVVVPSPFCLCSSFSSLSSWSSSSPRGSPQTQHQCRYWSLSQKTKRWESGHCRVQCLSPGC